MQQADWHDNPGLTSDGPERLRREVECLVGGSMKAAADASARLGLEVNLTRVDPVTWEGDDDGFVATVKARPHVALAVNATGTEGIDGDPAEPRPEASR